MKKRVYVMLWGLGSFVASLIVAFFVGGIFAGITWLFIVGDNPDPNNLISTIPNIVAILTVIIITVIGIIVGNKRYNKMKTKKR